MKYFFELTLSWSLIYSVIVLVLLVVADGYWTIIGN